MDNRWEELTNYLTDGMLEIDNNGAENQIKPFALGRKNRLFSGSPRGARYFIASLQPPLQMTGTRLIIFNTCLKTSVPAKRRSITPIFCRSISSQKTAKSRDP